MTVILVICCGRTVLECKTKQLSGTDVRACTYARVCLCRLNVGMQMCEYMDTVRHIYSAVTASRTLPSALMHRPHHKYRLAKTL